MTIKKNLADLKSAVAEKAEASSETEADVVKTAVVTEKLEEIKPVIDVKGRAYGTGRRKDAVARVWVSRGSGKIVVNGRDVVQYFARGTQRLIINQPFELSSRTGQFDVMCMVSGGGLSGQAGAVRHGISRALVNFEPGLRMVLKKSGMLTRDSRIVERKKYGRHKARKSTQWVKR
ncbi:MAG: 30S ribosomal protein S9 [Alphaproteobacteria bacterium]|nr:30S ribosomal protein S9 [Alphaproteobacteria bacterium]MCK5658406.1 30S ribosomal protein S9 [Alphaproteobacteria bacterium]